MLRLAIVDDHEIVRAGIREVLAGELDMCIAFEAASGEAALAELNVCECDVLLLDLSLPGLSGVDVLRSVRLHHPALRVLVLSGFPEERYAVAMIRSGADGYFCKDCEREEFIRAIRTVAQGRHYVSARAAQRLADNLMAPTEVWRHEQLSQREMQVFLRLARGESVTDIAQSLNLSVKTVSTYRSRLLEKLGVSSNAELATYALSHGLVLA